VHTPDTSPPSDHEYELPCAEAMLAGTLALMTGYAQQSDEHMRCLMATKVASNLLSLSEHVNLTQSFRLLLRRLRWCWDAQLSAADAAFGMPTAVHCHNSPSAVQ
jgi:hypothetical protein